MKAKKWISSHKAASIAAILALVVIIGVAIAFLVPRGYENQSALFYAGDASLIQKSAQRQKQFIIGSADIPETAAPCRESGQAAQAVTKLVYEPLVKLTARGEPRFLAAQSVVFSEDGKTAEIALREKQFSDGTALDADGVLEAYRFLNRMDSSYPEKNTMLAIDGMKEYQANEADSISGITKKDDGTLVFSFVQASEQNVLALTLPLCRVQDEENPYALGTGPYCIESLSGLENIVLVSNAFYGENDYGYQEIQFQNMPLERLETAVKDFEIDMVYTGESLTQTLKDAGYFDLYEKPFGVYSYIGFNLWDQSERAHALRSGVACAVDREAFIKTIRQGKAPVTAVTAMEKKTPDFGSVNQQSAERAKEWFSKARGGQAGLTLRLLCKEDSASRAPAKVVAEQLSALGVEVKQEFVDAVTFSARIASGEGYDPYFDDNVTLSPAALTRQALSGSEYKEEYAGEIEAALREDCRGALDTAEAFIAERALIVPMDAAARYLAVSADCKNDAVIDLLL